MTKQGKSKSGCFSSFLRVFLCAGNATSPPVHPSDQVIETEETEQVHSKREKVVDNANTPSVVARLMGLDSLPNTNWGVKKSTPDSFPRSRSVNFVDYLLEFDLNQANHRRVKTSASFREVPGLAQSQQKRDLFVFYFDENERKDQEDGFEERKSEMGLEELSLKQRKKQGNKKNEILSVKKERNQGKSKKISKLKNEKRRVPSSKHSDVKDLSSVSSSSSKSSCSCKYRYSGESSSSSSRMNSSVPNKHKKGSVGPKIRNNVMAKKIESEENLENLSPVSVLDINPLLYGADFQDDASTIASKSKWKSSSLVEDRASNNKVYGYTDINKEAEYYLELMLKLSNLTEKDIRELDFTTKSVTESESFEEICYVFEHKIFDHLLYEVVNELF